MATKQKQKQEHQNGAAHEPMDVSAAQKLVQQAEQAADERFYIEYQRLCEYHKRRIQMVPNGLNNDSSIRWVEAIRRMQ